MIDTPKKQNEETRKLQMTGGSTYIISLPKKWVTQNQLKKGSSLLIREEEDGLLSILPPELREGEKSEEALLVVSTKLNPNVIVRTTVSTYLVGYNVIRIRAESQQNLSSRQRNTLKNFARQLLVGTEIVSDTQNELTLQVLLSYPELSVKSALRRMCIITSSMHRDAITALKEQDQELAKSVIATDNEVDRFQLYMIRQLKMAVQNPRIIKSIGLSNARDCLGYRLITKSVERTADHAANIAENVLLVEKRIDHPTLEKIEKMSTLSILMFETAIESLFEKDFDLAQSVMEKAKEVISMEKEAMLSSQKAGTEVLVGLRLLIESVRRTAEYATDIAEIVLNMNVEQAIACR